MKSVKYIRKEGNTVKQLTDEQFDKIVCDYSQMLFKVAYSYTKSIADSEDIVQEVFMKLYRARKVFENDEHIKNWLIRVTINQSINEIKRNKKELLIGDEYINNLPDTSDADKKNEEIRECVMSLKDNYKNVIILFYYDEYSINEIANILKISNNNVKVILNRARKKLKDEINKRGRRNEK